MASAHSESLEYCAELAYSPAGTFSISHRFARPEIQNKLLVLHAFLQSVGSIPFTASDPTVALAKVSWWRQELEGEAQGDSLHPLVGAMSNHGVLEDLQPADLDNLFLALAGLASGEPISTMAELAKIAGRFGGAAASMEAGLATKKPEGASLSSMGTAIYQAIRLLSPGATLCGQAWWLPLELQARHGVTLEDLVSNRKAGALRTALEDIGRPVLANLRSAALKLQPHDNRFAQNAGVHHLLITAALLEKRLKRALTQTPDASHSVQSTPVEVFTAWRQAIRLRRRTGRQKVTQSI